jgi:capsular polysaccharide biosynthesis protein
MQNNNLNDFDESVSLNRPNGDNVEYVEEEKEGITLGQIWHMIIKHWVALVIVALVGLAGGFAYSKFFKTPKYQSTVKMMIKSGSTTTSADGEISLALKKAQIAYGYLTTDEVATSVGKKMGAKNYDVYLKDDSGKKTENIDVTAVMKLYSVSIPTVTSNNTSIFLSITSTCKTEAMAIDVANFVATSAIELTNDTTSQVYGYLNNSLSSMGTAYSAKDSSTSTMILSLIGLLAGVVIGAAYGIIYELVDNRVKSKSDLETLTGYKVIGMVPKYDNLKAEEEENGGKNND